MKFSIIIPIYNVEKYLAECLESALFQTYSDYEVICVEDASTDDSYNVLLEYSKKNKKIIVVKNEKNEGLSYSRNKGIEIASGDYVLFLDSDDYIEKNCLQTIAENIKESDVEIVNYNYKILMEPQMEIINPANLCEECQVPIDGKTWFYQSVNNGAANSMACSKAYKRDFLLENKISFYENLLHEDELFHLQTMLRAQKVIAVQDSLYIYRKRSNSITTTISKKRLDSYMVLLSEYKQVLEQEDLEIEMKNALRWCIKVYITEANKALLYFPEYKKMKIGDEKAQKLYKSFLENNEETKIKYVNLNEKELQKIREAKKSVVYGAGAVAQELLQVLEKNKITVSAVAVSNKEQSHETIMEYEIRQIDEYLKDKNDVLVIVAVTNKYKQEMANYLEEQGFKNILFLDTERTCIENWGSVYV